MPFVETFDLVIIGGGIHGAGVMQAAAAAGHSVLLLEQTAPAAGTSSRSSKLIHGGLRYLESGEFSLVRESLHERELLLRLAPDLVRRSTFHVPLYHDTGRRPLVLHTGLILYWLLAGIKPQTGYHRVPRKEWRSLDGLSTDGLKQVFAYTDAQTDDRLLTRAVINSAISLGAQMACPAQFLGASISANGCEITWNQDGVEKQCNASAVVNAAGPWARDLSHCFEPKLEDFPVDNIQGAHIEVDGCMTTGCYYLEAPQDRRAVFVMPWKGHTMIGTTENSYSGDPAAVKPLDSEIRYLQSVFSRYFPDRETTIIDAWAGLRVLPAAEGVAFRRSRETQLPVDNPKQPRVLTIYGGKLTGYRVTAEKVIRKLAPSLPPRKPRADTTRLPLQADD